MAGIDVNNVSNWIDKSIEDSNQTLNEDANKEKTKGLGPTSRRNIDRFLKGVQKITTADFDSQTEKGTGHAVARLMFNQKFIADIKYRKNEKANLDELESDPILKAKVKHLYANRKSYMSRFVQIYDRANADQKQDWIPLRNDIRTMMTTPDLKTLPNLSKPTKATTTRSASTAITSRSPAPHRSKAKFAQSSPGLPATAPRRVSTALKKTSKSLRRASSGKTPKTTHVMSDPESDETQKPRGIWYLDKHLGGRKGLLSYTDEWMGDLIEAADQFVEQTNPDEDIWMTIYLKHLPVGCTSAVVSGLKIALNGIEYLKLEPTEIYQIIRKFKSSTTDNGLNLRQLLESINPNKLRVIGYPAGKTFQPYVPIAAFCGNWATLHALKLIIEAALPDPIRTASRCHQIKVLAGTKEVYLQSVQGNQSEHTSVAACHGGFSRASHEGAVSVHGVMRLHLMMISGAARQIEQVAKNQTFLALVKTCYRRLVEKVVVGNRARKPDSFFTDLIAKYCKKVVYKHIRLSLVDELWPIAALQWALTIEGANNFDLTICANYQELGILATAVFEIIRTNQPNFGPISVFGYVKNESDLVPAITSHCSAIIVKESLITTTKSVPVAFSFSDNPEVMTHCRKVYRCFEKGKFTFDLVTGSDEDPRTGQPVCYYDRDRNLIGTVCADLWLQLTVEYDIANPEIYGEEKPSHVSDYIQKFAQNPIGDLSVYYTLQALEL